MEDVGGGLALRVAEAVGISDASTKGFVAGIATRAAA